MLRKADYNYIVELLNTVKAFELDSKKKSKIQPLFSDFRLDYKLHTVYSTDLYDILYQSEGFRHFVNDEKSVPLNLFLALYVHLNVSEECSNCKAYSQVLNRLRAESFYKTQSNLQDDLEFITLSYFLLTRRIDWAEFTRDFDANDWSDIHLLAEVFPLSQASVNDFLIWISKITKAQERDLALNTLSKPVYDWVIHKGDGIEEIEAGLLVLANDPATSRFFPSVLKGLRDKQEKPTNHYRNLLENSVNRANAFTIMFGIGLISQNRDVEKMEFLDLIIAKVNGGDLPVNDFIRLSSRFSLYNPEVLNKIDSVIETTEEKEEVLAIIQFLQPPCGNIDEKWYSWAAHIIMSKKDPFYKEPLDHLLTQIAETNLGLAYDLFTFRLYIMGGIELLDKALIHMVAKDPSQFQSMFVKWLVSNDKWIHNGILHISSLSSLGKSLFDIPSGAYEPLPNRQKLFVAYKTVGYVYSMEALQLLILSLIKSIRAENNTLREGLEYILIEYLIYNYRGTLDLVRKDLQDVNLSPFARELFERACNYYENYFSQLRGIAVDREIMPYKEHNQLRNFYQRKLFENIPKTAEKNSISSLFKSVQINANNWAIRRPNELKHKPSPLGHISVTSEFPSGEKLDPIYQEFIRRTYQKLEMDEINID